MEKMIVNEVNSDFLMEYTENIACEVRLSGSEEELRAFQYVDGKLKEFGLNPHLEFCDALISLPGEAALVVGGQAYECITHSMAAPTPEEGLAGELIYIDRKAENQPDPSGKLILLDGLATGPAVEWVQKSGAIGAVFINADYTHEMIVSSVWGSPTTETIKLLPKVPVVSVTNAIGVEIKSMILNGAALPAMMKTIVNTGWREIPVMTAEVKGASDDFVLFSGHIDSWHYGAMDNGTANATMVEVARILSAHKDELKRSVRFAFWSGHSHGRYAASAWYNDRYWEELYEHAVVHVNIDSVGAKGATVLTQSNCMEETKPVVQEAIRDIAGQEYVGTRYSRSGDQSFWGIGLPSLLMGLSEQPAGDTPAARTFGELFGGGNSGGYGWWWHTTEDTMDKVDRENLARDCKIYLQIIYEFATVDILPIRQSRAIREIKAAIKEYAKKVGGRLNFGTSLERIEKLEEAVVKLEGKMDEEQITSMDAEIFNSVIKKLSRVLVPLNYVKGDRFDHDLAVNPVCIPLLEKAEMLAETEVGTDEDCLLRNELRRALNKVNFALLEAIRIVEAALQELR